MLRYEAISIKRGWVSSLNLDADIKHKYEGWEVVNEVYMKATRSQRHP